MRVTAAKGYKIHSSKPQKLKSNKFDGGFKYVLTSFLCLKEQLKFNSELKAVSNPIQLKKSYW